MKKLVEPSCNGELVSYGVDWIHIGAFGLNAKEYIKKYNKIKSAGLRCVESSAKFQIDFVLYCDLLLGIGENIDAVVGEFNVAQKGDGSDLLHAVSLARLFYHYAANGFDVIVKRTDGKVASHDLEISGVSCELKVRIDQTDERCMRRAGGPSWRVGQERFLDALNCEMRTLDEDMAIAIRNVVSKGFLQASCVILDLSSHFHSWNYYRLSSMLKKDSIEGVFDTPIKPFGGACIMFSSDNVINLAVKKFVPRAYWGYIELEKYGFLREA